MEATFSNVLITVQQHFIRVLEMTMLTIDARLILIFSDPHMEVFTKYRYSKTETDFKE